MPNENQYQAQKTTANQRFSQLHQAITEKDKDMLWTWIQYNLKIEIPRRQICKDHNSPFDFICDVLFGQVNFAVVLANRSGGKTENFAVLDTILSYYYDGVEIATVGAIQFQAEKCYSYFKDFSQLYPFNENVADMTMRKTELRNGSKVGVLTGTMSGVNSPHPQILFVDEIDLMSWQILQQALSMPQSKNGVPSITVLTSTRKFAGGAMQRLIDDAPNKGYKVYQWCIWEVIQPLPLDQVEVKRIQEIFGNELPAKISDKKVVIEDGEIMEADGYYLWQDAINKKLSPMEIETWEVEWLCKRPGLEGVIYGSSYSDEENLIEEWSPEGREGYIYLFEDFGYGESHPDVVLFAWIPRAWDRVIIFDELYMTKTGTEDIWKSVNEKLNEYGYRLPDRARNIQGTVKGWISDPHGLTEIADRLAKGAPIEEKDEDSKMYIVNNGIVLVGKMLTSGRLMITEKCINLRMEFLSYKRKKNLDGTYSKEPDKKNDHGPDATRYGMVKLAPLIESRINDKITENIREKEKIEVKRPRSPEQKTITSGNFSQIF